MQLEMGDTYNTPIVLFRKEPETSRLGKKLIREAIDFLIAQGLERLTFKKLAEQMGSTEASIYRYFTNKHQMFCYLVFYALKHLLYYLQQQKAEVAETQQYQILLRLLNPELDLYEHQYALKILGLFFSWQKSETEVQARQEIDAAIEPLQPLCDLGVCFLLNSGVPPRRVGILKCLLMFQIMSGAQDFYQFMGLSSSEYLLFWEDILIREIMAQGQEARFSFMRGPDVVLGLDSPSEFLEEPEAAVAFDTPEEWESEEDAEPESAEEEPSLEQIPPAEISTSDTLTEVSQTSETSQAESESPSSAQDLDALPANAYFVHKPEEETFQIASVMVRKAGGYSMLDLKEFFTYEHETRLKLVREGKVYFISDEGLPMEMVQVLDALQAQGLRL